MAASRRSALSPGLPDDWPTRVSIRDFSSDLGSPFKPFFRGPAKSSSPRSALGFRTRAGAVADSISNGPQSARAPFAASRPRRRAGRGESVRSLSGDRPCRPHCGRLAGRVPTARRVKHSGLRLVRAEKLCAHRHRGLALGPPKSTDDGAFRSCSSRWSVGQSPSRPRLDRRQASTPYTSSLRLTNKT